MCAASCVCPACCMQLLQLSQLQLQYLQYKLEQKLQAEQVGVPHAVQQQGGHSHARMHAGRRMYVGSNEVPQGSDFSLTKVLIDDGGMVVVPSLPPTNPPSPPPPLTPPPHTQPRCWRMMPWRWLLA